MSALPLKAGPCRGAGRRKFVARSPVRWTFQSSHPGAPNFPRYRSQRRQLPCASIVLSRQHNRDSSAQYRCGLRSSRPSHQACQNHITPCAGSEVRGAGEISARGLNGQSTRTDQCPLLVEQPGQRVTSGRSQAMSVEAGCGHQPGSRARICPRSTSVRTISPYHQNLSPMQY